MAEVKALLETVRRERDDWRAQVLRRETDYELHQRAEHDEQVRILESKLSAVTDTEKVSKSKAKAAGSEADLVRNELAAERIAHEGALLDATTKLRDAEAASTKKLNITTAIKDRMIATRDAKLVAAQRAADEIQEALDSQLEVSSDRLSTVRKICGKLGGRGCLDRTDEDIELCSRPYRVRSRMAAALSEAIGTVGEDTEISTVVLTNTLKENGYLEKVWESELMWDLKMDWVGELRDDLSLAWDAQLTSDIRDRLVCSYDKLDELRFSLSHHRVGKLLRPRTWFINPWNNRRLNFPEPIRPRCGALGWTKLIKAMQERWGLVMDSTGRVAQRSFVDTVAKQLARDQARGVLRPLMEDDPLTCVLGADGTGVGKRSITHVACSVAPSYRAGISVENEKNINTVATSVTDDHWAGLNETLCGGYYTGGGKELPPTSIAAEINDLIASKRLPGTDTPVQVRGCFDLVAARGIRGGRGRCACHTETPNAERFGVPPITDSTTWAEAEKMLEKIPLLKSSDLRNDSHTPPETWDYSSRPWTCSRPGCNVTFVSDAEFRAARATFLTSKADKTVDGKKATAARAKKFAELHPSEQGEFEPPCTDIDMIDIIIDPLHDLMLNIPKVKWKYSFGDRMTNEQRELVAEYLSLIGCPLDIRAKGDGRDANRKWFTGEVLQRFVEGDGLSPGLAENIKAIMDIIYLKAPAPDPPPAAKAAKAAPAAPDAPHKNLTKLNGGGGAKKRKGGFTADASSFTAAASTSTSSAATPAAAPVSASTAAPVATAAPMAAVSPADDTGFDAALRVRYGSHMDSVRLGLDAWRAYGLLYAEWREPWTLHTTAYAESRALALLRCAVEVSKTLQALSLNKHKSWYTHLTVWVVPRQMAKHHDLWAFGTSPVEQRGARLKKFVRNVVSWRPYHDGWVAPAGPAEADGSKPASQFVARRKYESCSMMQVLRMCVSQEELWAAPAIACAQSGVSDLSVSERRMQAAGRSTMLKLERGKGMRLPRLKEELIDLT